MRASNEHRTRNEPRARTRYHACIYWHRSILFDPDLAVFEPSYSDAK